MKRTSFLLKSSSLALALVAAVGIASCSDDPACEESAYTCSGMVLQQCTDGAFVDVEDCAAKGANYMCHAEGGHCMMGSHTGGGSHSGGSNGTGGGSSVGGSITGGGNSASGGANSSGGAGGS